MILDLTAANGMTSQAVARARDGFAYAALVALVFFIYRASFAAYFVSEDFSWIFRCRLQPDRGVWTLLTSDTILGGAGTSWRPLLQLAFGLEHLVWGVNSLGYHFMSLAWHALAACALYALGVQITDRFRALIAATVFVAHPIQTESVTWVCASGGPLSTVFILLALRAAVQWRQRCGRLVFVLLPFGLALGTLESAAVLPALILTWDMLSNRSALLQRRSLRLYGGLAGVFVGFMILRRFAIWTPITLVQVGFDPRVPLQASALPNLLGQQLATVCALMLNLSDDVRWVALPAAFALALVAVWLWWRGAPIALWGLLWIAIAIAPFALWMLSGVIPRHLYLSVAGLGVLLAELIAQLYGIVRRHTPRLAVLCVSALVASYLLSVQRVIDRDEADWVARGDLHRRAIASLLAALPDPEPDRTLVFYGMGGLRGRGVFVYGFEDAVTLYYDDPSLRVVMLALGERVEAAYTLFYHPETGFELLRPKRR